MGLKTRLTAAALAATIAIAAPLVTRHEGRSLSAYYDPVGIVTICDGRARGVQMGQTATREQCDEWMHEDLTDAVLTVDRLTSVEISNNTRAALASFVYNVGSGAFARSTLLRKLNAGDIAAACNELPRWVHAGGKKLRGLERRREDERILCLTPDPVPEISTRGLWARILVFLGRG